MASSDSRYPILIDTDPLIAVANSFLWELLIENIGLTKTNLCKQEMKRHVDNTRGTAPKGNQPYRLHHGIRTELERGGGPGTLP